MAPTPARTGLRHFIINKFFPLFLFVLLYLGCFVFSNSDDSSQKKKRKLASGSTSPPPPRLIKKRHNRTISSSWSYIKNVFTKINKTLKSDHSAQAATPVLTSARSSHRSLVLLDQPPAPQELSPELHHQSAVNAKVITADNISFSFFSLRNNDIYPCTACGEIFHKTHLLEQHQTVKHAVSELTGEDSGRNIVNIIFKSSWKTTGEEIRSSPAIHRILKIHNSPKVLYRFEEYRELVKSKAAAAARSSSVGGGIRRRRDERCIADGNELLRFHCSTFMCQLGQDGNSTLCNQQFCSVCGIIRSGFSAKLDGISTVSTSWRAHVSIPDETLEEFQFMNVKRAVLVCRVVAGRVGADEGEELGEKEGCGFDSVVGRTVSGALDEEELLVFNPRAVLPCFVIVYTV